MEYTDINEVASRNFHDILVDLLSSLSSVKALSEMDNQQGKSEKELVLDALDVLISNQDMESCSFFIKTDKQTLVNLTGLSSEEATTGKHDIHQPLTFKMGEGVIGLAAQSGELQHCQNCLDDPRFSTNQQFSVPGSIISVPIMALGELFGVLNISHPDANYFSDWHLRLLEIYKNMLGQLISNFRLVKKMEQQIVLKTEHLQQALEEAHLLKQRYESLSMIDNSTGLFNRRFFYVQAAKAIAATHRYGDELCLLILNLDFFKAINDSCGHSYGDQVLTDVAIALKKQMRESDILARFGGEEFVVLFKKTDCHNGSVFAERIRQSIASLRWNFKQQELSITASIGVYCVEKNAVKAEDVVIDEFIHYADLAMYKAKSNGRNQVVVFTDDFLLPKES